MTRVFIYGSCVTRDSVDQFPDFGFEMTGYVARHSLLSAFRPARISEYDLRAIASSFQRRMTNCDITSGLIEAIEASDPDLIVWDMCDERLGVVQPATGGLVTRSQNFKAKGIHKGRPFVSRLEFGEDQHFSLWCTSLKTFLGHLERLKIRHKLILNDTPWAIADENGVESEDITSKALKFNELSRRYVAYAKTQNINIVSVEQSKCLADTKSHKWGTAPFHYVEDTYTAMLSSVSEKYAQIIAS